MAPDEVKKLLAAGIEAEHIQVLSDDGRHFDVVVVSKRFEGLRPVQKQQMVYAVLNQYIADGSVHAINMKTLTPSEFRG